MLQGRLVSRHVYIESDFLSRRYTIVSQFVKKDHEGKVLRSRLDFFVKMNVATGVTCVNNMLMKLLFT